MVTKYMWYDLLDFCRVFDATSWINLPLKFYLHQYLKSILQYFEHYAMLSFAKITLFDIEFHKMHFTIKNGHFNFLHFGDSQQSFENNLLKDILRWQLTLGFYWITFGKENDVRIPDCSSFQVWYHNIHLIFYL